MPFTLSVRHLTRLCEINNFAVPDKGIVFFGLRSCMPANVENHDFAAQHQMVMAELNYTNPRCTIGQWRPAQGDFAVYPGSTVPYIEYIKGAKLRNGAGVNQLMTGYYPEYQRKPHNPKTAENAHDAFGLREGALNYIRRTVDDLDYDTKDSFDVSNPHDNIHASYGRAVTSTYSSAGCQVIVGYPACRSTRFSPELGPWKIFKRRAYEVEDQRQFPYFLLEGRNAATVADGDDQPRQALLRFGSSGDLVRRLQEKLGIKVDGDFGETTLRAVIELQEHRFGAAEADGVVGGRTAAVIGLEWPNV